MPEKEDEFLPEIEPGYTRWKPPRLTLNKELIESLAAMTNVPIIKDLLREDEDDEDLEGEGELATQQSNLTEIDRKILLAYCLTMPVIAASSELFPSETMGWVCIVGVGGLLLSIDTWIDRRIDDLCDD